jgi:hypothetical protein
VNGGNEPIGAEVAAASSNRLVDREPEQAEIARLLASVGRGLSGVLVLRLLQRLRV